MSNSALKLGIFVAAVVALGSLRLTVSQQVPVSDQCSNETAIVKQAVAYDRLSNTNNDHKCVSGGTNKFCSLSYTNAITQYQSQCVSANGKFFQYNTTATCGNGLTITIFNAPLCVGASCTSEEALVHFRKFYLFVWTLFTTSDATPDCQFTIEDTKASSLASTTTSDASSFSTYFTLLNVFTAVVMVITLVFALDCVA